MNDPIEVLLNKFLVKLRGWFPNQVAQTAVYDIYRVADKRDNIYRLRDVSLSLW